METGKFEAWMKMVDREISRKVGFGITHEDLPDMNLMDWFEDGITPKRAAARLIKNAGGME